jgi:DNA-binding LacI/PurR family transcriptional regulator
MRSKKRVTHVDVAKRAGVSTAVVSYVINNGPRPTSPEVRERVIRAIHELDYHPNAMARGLRAQRTNTIGFVIDDYNSMDVFVSPYSAKILTGLTAQLKAHGYYLLLYPLDIGEDMGDFELLLRSGRLDGIVVRLVQDPPETDALLETIARTNVPCICIERPGAPRFGFGAVTYDDMHGAYEATSYLIAQGHRQIGHIAGDLRYSTGRARLAGYQRALAAHGITADAALVYSDTWAPVVGRLGAVHLLEQDAPPTAIFAASDTFAFNAIEELRTRGLRVPDDVAVIGFDDIGESAEHVPPLTTMRIPLLEIGRRAADLVLDVVESRHEDTVGRSEIVPVELVRRASS